jgi:hypothetical protein
MTMQTSNRLIYTKNNGGTFIKSRQFGGILGNLAGVAGKVGSGEGGIMKGIMGAGGGSGGGGLLSGAAGIAGDLVGGMFGPKSGGDPVQGAIDKGLTPEEMNEVENAGKGAGVASGILGTVGDLAGKIPGPWGAVAKFGLTAISGALGGKQAKEQKLSADKLIAGMEERKGDKSQMDALANMGQNGGLLYKKPNRILSLVAGGDIYKEGGKAPILIWNHSFNIEFQEGSLEKKKLPVKIFKRGGKFNHPDKTNVIVAGARHHESNSLGDKGVPVVDDSGEKVFEVETGELILTKDATARVEKFLSKYKKVEIDEDKAHDVLKALGTYFKEEIKDNLHNYEEKNAV